jgi:GDP-4-dehydro-6-deoxy-D-mannose reductase
MMTGGRGFVGRYLSPRLERLYPNHRRVMILQSEADAFEGAAWEGVVCDLGDEAAVHNLIARYTPEVVVHMAAQASVGQAQRNAGSTWRTNVMGTLILAEAIARNGAGKGLVLFTSTGEVYGASCLAGPAREDTPAAPNNSYALTKLAGERIFQDLLPPETRLIVTRAFNHSGVGQDERFVLPSFAAQIARAERENGDATISVGNLAAERDFLHVEDVAAAYEQLLRTAETLPSRTVVNIASGEPRSMESILDLMLARARRPITVSHDPARMRPSEIPIMTGDATRLRELTGWKPARSVETIVDDLLAASRAGLES